MKSKFFIGTFGQRSPNKDRYTKVFAQTKDEVQQKMYERYGNNWSMVYEDVKNAGIETYNLKWLEDL